MEDKREVIENIDKKMQENGWKFLGAILHYEGAWKDQASVYEKNGKYIASGLDSTGENELNESISKKEAEERLDESIKEIRKFMFGVSE
ncbi:MAG: hypothetical protein DRO67_04390 [Candidatus Asgardarchaeum californiense]|nr:MAG: hypothetical protein DRO67_04390 [Candidatus Asgardarchaeum californiense]